MNIEIKKGNTPTEEGYYFHVGKTFGDVELVEVKFIPAVFHGGIEFKGYFGVPSHGGKSVHKLENKYAYFSEKLNFSFKN